MNDTMNDSNDSRRITLITRGTLGAESTWEYSRQGSSRAVFVDKFSVFRWAVSSRVGQSYLDLERVIIDRACTADDFLAILSSLAPGFCGDVVFIGESGAGYLSAAGRGGDRVLYAMTASDLHFYLDTHALLGEARGSIAA